MKADIIEVDKVKIAHVSSDTILIAETQHALDLLGSLYYDGFDSMIIYERNLSSDFFDLKTGIAGDILQKFSNYRMRLAIVGDFSTISSKSLRDFIFESNKNNHVSFVSSLEEAIDRLSK